MSLEQLSHNELQSVEKAASPLFCKDVDVDSSDRMDLPSKESDFHIDEFDHDSIQRQEMTKKEELLSSAELRDKCKDAKNVGTFLDFDPDSYDEDDEDDYLLYPFFNLNTGVLIE